MVLSSCLSHKAFNLLNVKMFLCTVMYSLFTVLLTLSLSQRGHCYGHQPRQVASSIASINQSTWNAFNATVSGHLHNGEPMMAPCYTDYDGVLKYPDVAECFVLQSARSDTVLVSDYFGGYINVRSCLFYHQLLHVKKAISLVFVKIDLI